MITKYAACVFRVVLLLSLSLPLFAFQGKAVVLNKLASPTQVRHLLDRISTLPVEYKADISFSVLQQWPAAIPLRMQTQLLKELFDQARQARYESAIVSASGGGGTVVHQQELDLGWFPLDALDIQSRVVSLMRNHSKVESWSLLQQMTLPTHQSTCRESFTETFSSYYMVMASSIKSFAQVTLPNGQSKTAYLVDQAARLSSPAQIEAFLDALVTLDLTESQLSPVFDQVVVRLNLVEGSDREMYGAEGKQQSLTSAITRLVSKERQLGFDPTSTLLAYRTFLIHNLHGVACADTSLDRQAEAIAFNKIDTKLTGESPELVKTLSVEELRATSIGDSANIEKIGGAPEVERETHRLFLVFAANQKAAHFSDSPDSYMQPEPDDVNAVLRCEADKSAMAAFSPLGQYETKQSTLMLLIDLLPPGPSFEDATDAELAYLNLNPIEQVSPESWLRAFKTLLLISRPIEPTHLRALRETAIKQGGMAMPPSPNAEFIRKKMQHYQSDPAISAYMALEDLFTPVYQTYEESLRKSPL